MEPGRHNRGDALTVDLFQPTPYFDANQVAPGIWVGSLPAEQSPIQEFKTRSITHVVRCGVAYIPAEHEDELTYLKLDDHFTADERVARGNEWLAKRQGAHAPEPPSAGIWKPKKINSVMPPADVLAPDPDEQPACSVLIKT
ncbi:hypothetical protein WJX84_005610 [Apatococcus fuscideae]|uniref:Uncharacterized protein n=1 Tax=Apatococcus fuscideae TaxID=2026836 RepID=A0AAW1T0L3_9CHLO